MKNPSSIWMIGAAAAALIAAAAGIWAYWRLDARLASMADATQELAQKQLELSDAVYAAQQGLADVGSKLGGFQSEVSGITGTVSTLQKLSATDRELLQKYSKIFFLNEHYAPAELSAVDQALVYSNTRPEKVIPRVKEYLERMIGDARADGAEMYVKSAYRSFEEQKALKSAYTVLYGAGTANAFSADQGYSEHQLGTAVDLVAPGQAGALNDAFEASRAYQWLAGNAYKYGFILSYPKGNAYYVYEPWHWRFVGVKLATYLHDQGKNFYDIEQREIDGYLADIFD
jgi:LAS superfamily LD-carboxypeptidase LdcB